jgi:gliding motility associated protien GldN
MKKITLTLIVVLFCSFSYGQVFENAGGEQDTAKKTGVMDPIRPPIDGTYTKIHLTQFKPMSFAHYREADVLYSSLVWSVIDLREKFNHPLYYPTTPKGNWKCLMQAILDATTDTTEANPMPLRVYSDEYVNIPYTIEGLRENTGRTKIEPKLNDYGEEIGQQTLFIPFGSREVFQYVIKDQYVIDKQRSVKDSRIISVSPMFWVEQLNTDGYQEEAGDDNMPSIAPRRWRSYGWMYFPEMRSVLAVTEVFNSQNNAQRRTYDDIFVQRRYSSFIRAVENVHDNRDINEYFVNGMDQRLEAEYIKLKLQQREDEMWEY